MSLPRTFPALLVISLLAPLEPALAQDAPQSQPGQQAPESQPPPQAPEGGAREEAPKSRPSEDDKGPFVDRDGDGIRDGEEHRFQRQRRRHRRGHREERRRQRRGGPSEPGQGQGSGQR